MLNITPAPYCVLADFKVKRRNRRLTSNPVCAGVRHTGTNSAWFPRPAIIHIRSARSFYCATFLMKSNPKLPQSRRRPKVLSIKQLVRLYCRERLMVKPAEWTGRHLELLQCSFESSPALEPSRKHQDELKQTLDGNSAFRTVETLAIETSIPWRLELLSTLLSSNWGDPLTYFE